MLGHNVVFLVVPYHVTSKLQNLCCKIFEDSSKVDLYTCMQTLCIFTFLQQMGDMTNRELRLVLTQCDLDLQLQMGSFVALELFFQYFLGEVVV